MVQFIDPRARVGVEIDSYDLGIDLLTHEQPKIAFLANGFPDSVAFLQQVRDALRALIPGIQPLEFDKGNASITVSDDMLAEIEGADAAIAAYGH